MNVLLVTYDLNNEIVRPKIIAEIRKGGNWAKLSESSYAIGTDETPQQVYDRFASLLDGDDNFYVVTLKLPYYGQGPQEVNTWLANSLPG